MLPGQLSFNDLPIEDPILIFGVAMVVFLVAPLVLERYRLPGILGIILVGAAVGPNGANFLARDSTFVLLGEVGLVYLMFLAGLEINFNRFIEYRRRSVVFGSLSFLIPQIAGTLGGIYLLGLGLGPALLFGAIFSSHTLLAYPVVNRLNIAKNEAMTVTIGGTILTDTLALLVLAVVIAAFGGVIGVAFWTQLAVGLGILFGGVWLVVPRVGRWFFRAVDQESYFDFLFVMAVLFICAYLAEAIGVKHIIGAFLAGLALNRLIPDTGALMNRIEFVGNALFIPFFLLSVGMLVDLWVVFDGQRTLLIAATLVVLVVTTKYAAAAVTGRIFRYDRQEVLGMFGLSVGQAAAALAIVLVAFDAGLPGFDQHMINGVVLMILVISLLSPTIVDRAGRKLRQAEEIGDYSPSTAPQRILIPFARASPNKERLIDLAMLLRDPQSVEPLYTVSVVPPDGKVEAEIERVEESLSSLEKYTAGAEIPTDSRIQLNHSPATGIVRALLENRITTLVIGWDGARSRRQTVFGSVIDQVLRRTTQQVFVSRVSSPVRPTERMLVVLPPDIDHNDGFYEVVNQLKLLASHTGASIHGIAIDGDPDLFDQLFDLVDPEVPATFERIADWQSLTPILKSATQDELVVCLSARRGTIGWHEELQTVPKRISTTVAGNFIVVYPGTADSVDQRKFFRFT